MVERVAFYFDGFNLYHAIDRLGFPHLKWVDLRSLAKHITPRHTTRLEKVTYFSAFATHLVPEKLQRHRAYVRALEARGVSCVMGRFKRHPVKCLKCGNTWQKPEEKETDVNIAVHLLDEAYQDLFDHAYLVTADSDLVAGVRLFKQRFPDKKLTSVAPPGRPHSKEILAVADGHIALNQEHIGRCLLPDSISDSNGTVIAVRPSQYNPS